MQNTKEDELEIELGMSLSDIISLDNESIPPTLPGTPNVQGNVMAQRKPKDVRLFQLEGRSTQQPQQQQSQQQQQQPQQQQQQRRPPPQYNSQHHQNSRFQGGKNQSHSHSHSGGGFRGHNNSNSNSNNNNNNNNNTNDYNDRRHQSPPGSHNHNRPNRSSSPPAGNFTNPTPTQLNYQNQQNQQRRKNRPQSWGGTSQSWRGSYSSDKNVAIITCAGCNVQIPANQAVGHASQCNRLQGSGKRSSGSLSPISSPRKPGAKKSNRDSFTSAYSLFIAKELEGVKVKRDDVTPSKWKEMTAAEKFHDLSTRNRLMKETLLQRMTAATAKWEGMNPELRKPFIEEAAKNRGEDVAEDTTSPRVAQPPVVASPLPKPEQIATPSALTSQQALAARKAKRVSWSPEASVSKEALQRNNMALKRVSWGPEDIAKWDSHVTGPPQGGETDGTGDATQLAQLALYLTEVGLVPTPKFGAPSADSSLQSIGCFVPHLSTASCPVVPQNIADCSNLSLPTAYHTVVAPTTNWDVASATDSESSVPITPPSPTYTTTTAKLSAVAGGKEGPEAIRALLDCYESDSDEDEVVVQPQQTTSPVF